MQLTLPRSTLTTIHTCSPQAGELYCQPLLQAYHPTPHHITRTPYWGMPSGLV